MTVYFQNHEDLHLIDVVLIPAHCDAKSYPWGNVTADILSNYPGIIDADKAYHVTPGIERFGLYAKHESETPFGMAFYMMYVIHDGIMFSPAAFRQSVTNAIKNALATISSAAKIAIMADSISDVDGHISGELYSILVDISMTLDTHIAIIYK